MSLIAVVIKDFHNERHGIQRPPVLAGTPGPSTSADVGGDVGGGTAKEHKALWEAGGVCVHGNRCCT